MGFLEDISGMLKGYGMWIAGGGLALALISGFGLFTADWATSVVVGLGMLAGLTNITRTERMGLLLASSALAVLGGVNIALATPFIGGLLGTVVNAITPFFAGTAVLIALVELWDKIKK